MDALDCTTVFFKLFDAQINPMLLYTSEIWGTKKMPDTETAHHFSGKRPLCVSNKTLNHMIYADKRRYPLHDQLPQTLAETLKNAHEKVPKVNVDYAEKRLKTCMPPTAPETGQEILNSIWNHMVFRMLGQME